MDSIDILKYLSDTRWIIYLLLVFYILGRILVDQL